MSKVLIEGLKRINGAKNVEERRKRVDEYWKFLNKLYHLKKKEFEKVYADEIDFLKKLEQYLDFIAKLNKEQHEWDPAFYSHQAGGKPLKNIDDDLDKINEVLEKVLIAMEKLDKDSLLIIRGDEKLK